MNPDRSQNNGAPSPDPQQPDKDTSPHAISAERWIEILKLPRVRPAIEQAGIGELITMHLNHPEVPGALLRMLREDRSLLAGFQILEGLRECFDPDANITLAPEVVRNTPECVTGFLERCVELFVNKKFAMLPSQTVSRVLYILNKSDAEGSCAARAGSALDTAAQALLLDSDYDRRFQGLAMLELRSAFRAYLASQWSPETAAAAAAALEGFADLVWNTPGRTGMELMELEEIEDFSSTPLFLPEGVRDRASAAVAKYLYGCLAKADLPDLPAEPSPFDEGKRILPSEIAINRAFHLARTAWKLNMAIPNEPGAAEKIGAGMILSLRLFADCPGGSSLMDNLIRGVESTLRLFAPTEEVRRKIIEAGERALAKRLDVSYPLGSKEPDPIGKEARESVVGCQRLITAIDAIDHDAARRIGEFYLAATRNLGYADRITVLKLLGRRE